MEFRAKFVAMGPFSFATGYAKFSSNLFDELRKNPRAVINRLHREGRGDVAERIIDEILPTINTGRK